jgi:hypothetical protein
MIKLIMNEQDQHQHKGILYFVYTPSVLPVYWTIQAVVR